MQASTGRRRIEVGLAVAGALLALASLQNAVPVSLARFVDADVTGAAFAADTLDPPTALSATGGLLASLAWTPSIDTYATGYRVLRSATSGSGHVQVATVTPVTVAGTTDTPPAAGTWYYVLETSFQSWDSLPTAEVSATIALSPLTTPFQPCGTGSSAPEPGWGDGNGYETSSDLACVDGLGYALDEGTGTAARSGSCANMANDAHRYRDFSLGLPPGALAIQGIEIRADVGLNNNGGTSNLCIQLSWDGGASWTTARSVQLSGPAEATYVLGSGTDTWGRAWAVSDLSNANFRVRVIDATTQNTKDYRLEFLAVRVTYST